jgi:hypothetical protein
MGSNQEAGIDGSLVPVGTAFFHKQWFLFWVCFQGNDVEKKIASKTVEIQKLRIYGN